MGQYYETFYPPFFMDLSYRHDAIAANRDGYNRHDDSIVSNLRESIIRLLPGETANLSISSQNQVVTLSGSVSSSAVSRFICNVADRILGVRSVINRLDIKRAGAEARPKEAEQDKKNTYLEPQTTFSEL